MPRADDVNSVVDGRRNPSRNDGAGAAVSESGSDEDEHDAQRLRFGTASFDGSVGGLPR